MRRLAIFSCCALLAFSGTQADPAAAAEKCNKAAATSGAGATANACAAASAGSTGSASSTKSVLAKHGLTQFDVDGNGTLDPSERAAAMSARKTNRKVQVELVAASNRAALAQASLNVQASYAAASALNNVAALNAMTGGSTGGRGMCGGMGGGGMGVSGAGMGAMGMGGAGMGMGGGMGMGAMGGGMGMASLGPGAGMGSGGCMHGGGGRR